MPQPDAADYEELFKYLIGSPFLGKLQDLEMSGSD